MYTEDLAVLVVVSETVGLFDDVISAYVFGLPDSERCAGTVQHSKDKATDHNFDKFGNENLLLQNISSGKRSEQRSPGLICFCRILAQESGQNKGVQA